jgi:hypothetical protein
MAAAPPPPGAKGTANNNDLARVVAAVAPPREQSNSLTAGGDLLAATGLERFAAAAERMQPKALYSRIAVPGGPPVLYRAGDGTSAAAALVDPWSLAPLAQAHVGPPPPAASAGPEALASFVAGLPAGRYVLPEEARGVRVAPG